MPFDRAHVAAAEQVNFAVSTIAEIAPRGRANPAIGCQASLAVSYGKALGMRATVLLDEAAERVDLRPDGDAGHMIAWQWKRGLLRPIFRFEIVDLVKAAIDAMTRVAGDHMKKILPMHSITACSPTEIGRRGCSTQRPGLADIGATLVM